MVLPYDEIEQSEQEIRALRRLHLTRVRLLKAGWRITETGEDGEFTVEVRPPGMAEWKKIRRRFYADALGAALKLASHVQARIDAGAKR